MITQMNTTEKTSIHDNTLQKGDGLEVRAEKVKQLSSSTLFGDAKEIVIAHLGEIYMLTITKHKKLLLTKIKHHFL